MSLRDDVPLLRPRDQLGGAADLRAVGEGDPIFPLSIFRYPCEALVQPRRELLAEPARIDKHDGGAVGYDLLKDDGFQIRPDRGGSQLRVRSTGRAVCGQRGLHEPTQIPIGSPGILLSPLGLFGYPLPRGLDIGHVGNGHPDAHVDGRRLSLFHDGHRMHAA